MDIDQALADFCRDDGHLPRDAMQWCLENWESASNTLLERLEIFAGDPSGEDAADAGMFALYLAAEIRDKRFFPVLLKLAADEPALDRLIGDGITEDLARLVCSLWEGDFAAVRAVVEDPGIDEFIRVQFLNALLWFGLKELDDRAGSEALHFALYDRLEPRDRNHVWYEWAEIAVALNRQRALPMVKAACEDGRIDMLSARYEDFADEKRYGNSEDRLAELLAGSKPIGSAIEHLSGWYGFSQKYRDELAQDEELEDDAIADLDEEWAPRREPFPEPVSNPFRNVGRNDPCPCGSGKKYKKCCLAA